jgi:hypothetical protein
MFRFIIMLILFFRTLNLYSQISVAPAAVHLVNDDKTGYFYVQNNSDMVKEVEISLHFGYPVSDDSGKVFVKIFDTVGTNEPSAVRWIRIYPRRFLLNQKETQTVRFVIRPPANLTEGEYWARPSILSRSPKLEKLNGGKENPTVIEMDMNFFVSLNYRKGSVSTGVNFKKLNYNLINKKIILIAELERNGNAAYLGNIISRIRNKNGKVVKMNEQDIAVYYNLKKRIEIEISDLTPGMYKVEVELNTDRNEQGEIIIKSKSVNKDIDISIP